MVDMNGDVVFETHRCIEFIKYLEFTGSSKWAENHPTVGNSHVSSCDLHRVIELTMGVYDF